MSEEETQTQELPQTETSAPIEATPDAVTVPEEVTETPTTPTSDEQNTLPTEPQPQTAIVLTSDQTPLSTEPQSTEVKSNSNVDSQKESQPIVADQATPAAIRKYLLSLLAKGRMTVQTKKRKNLEKLMHLFTTQAKVTNNDVEKLLGVKDPAAGVYLNRLLKEGKIQRHGTKKGTWYSIK